MNRVGIRVCTFISALCICVGSIAGQEAPASAVATLLGESFAAMQAAKSFRATSVSEQGGVKATVQNDTIWPDRFHVRAGEQEFILVPGQTWLKRQGEWSQLPVDMSQMVQSLSPDAMRQTLDNLSNGKSLGSTEVSGKPALIIEYDTHATLMGIATRSHVKVWLDADSKLPIQQQVSGTAMGQKSHTFTVYDFDAEFTIEAPR